MGNWATRYRKEHPTGQDRRKASEAAEIAELMAEVRELRHENEFLKKQPPGLRRNDRDRGATEVGAAKKAVTPFPRCAGGPGVLVVRVLLLTRPTRVHVRHQEERAGRDGEGYF